MNEEKLDLILTVVSGLKLQVEKMEKQNVEFRSEIRQDMSEFRSEIRQDMSEFRNEVKQDVAELRSELRQTSKTLQAENAEIRKMIKALNQRINLVEKQIIQIAIEIKEEVRNEIQKLSKRMEILESETLFARRDGFDNRTQLREIETRLFQVERKVGLAA
jgi:septal ring factor EnvC (AmiA/AmiB activator)